MSAAYDLLNGVKRHADAQLQQMPQPKFAIVTSYNPATHRAQATLMPENEPVGWLPVMTPMTGSGFGVVIPPVVGQQCIVLPVDGAPSNYVIVGLAFSQQALPPAPGGNAVVPGEMAVVHQSGSYLHFRNNGDVLMSVHQNLAVTTSGNTTLTTTGNTEVASTGTTTVSGSSIALNSNHVTGGNGTTQRLATEEFVLSTYAGHTHGGVETGGGVTGVPIQQPNASSLTSNFAAS